VRPAAFRDLPELEDAKLAAIVQMNVDAREIAHRQIEHQVKLALHIAVEGGRVKPADGLDAELQGLFQQCRRAWRRAHADLRKSHKLDRNTLAHLLAQRQNHFQIGKVDFRIDIDVAAQRHRSLFHEQVNQRRCPSYQRRVDACADIFLDGDALLDGAAFQVENSRRAEQGLVEMDMAVHQPRRDQSPRHINLAHAFRCCQTFEYFGELPIANENVGGPAID